MAELPTIVVSARLPQELVAELDADDSVTRSEAVRLLVTLALGVLYGRPPLSPEALQVLAQRGWRRDI